MTFPVESSNSITWYVLSFVQVFFLCSSECFLHKDWTYFLPSLFLNFNCFGFAITKGVFFSIIFANRLFRVKLLVSSSKYIN